MSNLRFDDRDRKVSVFYVYTPNLTNLHNYIIRNGKEYWSTSGDTMIKCDIMADEDDYVIITCPKWDFGSKIYKNEGALQTEGKPNESKLD